MCGLLQFFFVIQAEKRDHYLCFFGLKEANLATLNITLSSPSPTELFGYSHPYCEYNKYIIMAFLKKISLLSLFCVVVR